jgi:hypothetical protein
MCNLIEKNLYVSGVLDNQTFEVHSNYTLCDPNTGELVFFEKFVVRVEGYYPDIKFTGVCHYIQSQEDAEENCWQESEFIPEHLLTFWKVKERSNLAIKSVIEHLKKTAYKFAIHTHLIHVLKLDIKRILNLSIKHTKCFVSYSFNECAGKGSTIIDESRLDIHQTRELTITPRHDMYMCVQKGFNQKTRIYTAGYTICIPKDFLCFISAECYDQTGYTRIDTEPQLTEEVKFTMKIDRKHHRYLPCLCIYDAIFADNCGQEIYMKTNDTVFSETVLPDPDTLPHGFNILNVFSYTRYLTQISNEEGSSFKEFKKNFC